MSSSHLTFFILSLSSCCWTFLEAEYWCRWIFALTRTELLDVKCWPFFSACIVNAFLHPLLQTIVQFQELVWFLLCSCDPPWSQKDERQYVMALFTVWTVTCGSASKPECKFDTVLRTVFCSWCEYDSEQP